MEQKVAGHALVEDGPIRFAESAFVAGSLAGRNTRATPLMPSMAPSTQGRFVFQAARLIQRRASRLSRPAMMMSDQEKRPSPQSRMMFAASGRMLASGRMSWYALATASALERPTSCARKRMERERFESSMSSRSTTTTLRKPSRARFFEDLVAEGTGSDDEDVGGANLLLIPPRDQTETAEAVVILLRVRL